VAESELQNFSWVFILGKWAWVIGLLNGILGIIYNIYNSYISYVIYRSYFSYNIYEIIFCFSGIIIALLIIRPKFSIPCGEEDVNALYRWGLNLGIVNIPWMLIWGFLLFLFGWYGWGGLLVLIPAVIIIFIGPTEYKWFKKKQPR
jgi:hypothetical protein